MLRLLGDRFWITSLVLMALALWLPGDWRFLTPVVPWCLGGILFFSGLRIPAGDVWARLADARGMRRVLGLALIKVLAIPALAWFICWMLAPSWALGVCLLAAMPAGFSSIALADVYGGNRMTALMLVAISSALVPLTVPAFLALLQPDSVPPLREMALQSGYLLALLASPFALAQLVRRFATSAVERGDRWWGPCTMMCSVLLVFVGIAANRHAWAEWSGERLLVPLLLSCVCVLVAVAAAHALRRWLTAPDATSFAMGCVYVNNGLAVAFVTCFFPGHPEMILPCVLIQAPVVLATAWLGARFRSHA